MSVSPESRERGRRAAQARPARRGTETRRCASGPKTDCRSGDCASGGVSGRDILSRHSSEQKCMTLPFTTLFSDESIATYVPQTGSCCSMVGGDARRRGLRSRRARMIHPEADARAESARNGPGRKRPPTGSRKSRSATGPVLQSGKATHQTRGLEPLGALFSMPLRTRRRPSRSAYFFFLRRRVGIAGTSYSPCHPVCAISSFAEGAKVPSGFSSRYFCSSSIVPGAAMILPSLIGRGLGREVHAVLVLGVGIRRISIDRLLELLAGRFALRAVHEQTRPCCRSTFRRPGGSS